ncbi:MAG TPA: hypothetical protein VGN81_17695 [Pseudonocardiaceae bacterium]|jgi:hypothetical protein
MPIAFFVISGILAGILTSLAQSVVHGMRQEYRNLKERKRLRIGLAERMSEHHGVPYEDIKPGKHRLEDSSAAHELCTDADPCAHRGWQNGMVHAEFYIERAEIERLAKELARREAFARREAEEWPGAGDMYGIPWPRDEDVWESDRFSGLLCGYRTPNYRAPSNFPGLSTPVGSSVDFTADSTSMPREPTSVGR